LKKVEFAGSKKIFLLSTSQKYPCDTAWKEGMKLQREAVSQYEVIYADNIIMPANQYFELEPIHLKQDLYEVGRITEAAYDKVAVIVSHILSNTVYYDKGKMYLKWFYFIIRRLERVIFKRSLNKIVEKLKNSGLDGKYLEGICPRNNVKFINGKIEFGNNCVNCLKCAQLARLADFEIEKEKE